jgi:hypothetical protein
LLDTVVTLTLSPPTLRAASLAPLPMATKYGLARSLTATPTDFSGRAALGGPASEKATAAMHPKTACFLNAYSPNGFIGGGRGSWSAGWHAALVVMCRCEELYTCRLFVVNRFF